MSELFVIANTLSVYFSVHALQSCCIKSVHHADITPSSLVYNAVLSILVARCLKPSVRGSWYYVLLSHASAFAVALVGEASPFYLVLTSGVWQRSDLFMRVFLSVTLVLLAVLMACRLRRSCSLVPLACGTLVWLYLWWVVADAGFTYYLHVHHALFYGFVSSFFSDDVLLDRVIHALCIGGVVEGFDFYGCAELQLFILTGSPVYHWWWVVPPLLLALMLSFPKSEPEPEEDDLTYELLRSPRSSIQV
jgi:hypothetical protein